MLGRFTPSSCLKIAVDPCAANERQQDSVTQSSSMVLFEFDLKGRRSSVRAPPEPHSTPRLRLSSGCHRFRPSNLRQTE
jgi:hypothetical protein